MNANIMDIKSKLPISRNAYDALDILGNTFGRYFDYKKETALIEHETEKVKQQAKVLCQQIDAELQMSLDSNDKNFQQEMFRLKSISKDLKDDAKTKKEIMNKISEYIEMLNNPNIATGVKEKIPDLIAVAHQLLAKESEQSFLKLNAMGSFNPNTKSIKR